YTLSLHAALPSWLRSPASPSPLFVVRKLIGGRWLVAGLAPCTQVAVHRRAHGQHGDYGRGEQHEGGEQQLVYHGAFKGAGQIQHGGDEGTAGAYSEEDSRPVDALRGSRQPPQAQCAGPGDQSAEPQQQRDGQGQPDTQIGHGPGEETGHSMISPRIRNLARAIEDTKPISATSSAASK